MPQQKLRIFLVDDDHIYQFTAKKTLEAMGFAEQVDVFPDGEKALDFIREHASNPAILPDIIFLDINMPIMDGWQFVEEFQKLDLGSKKVDLYMVSSSVDEADQERSRKYQVINDYIIKPVGRTRFEQLITEARD
ncbi:MAG: Response regulator receiver domain protein [Chitinophagaceae bacterium]|jgi:CheY-like chemotaxis protein|nr:Response regulator receiver domain protein [Chitinophagaceae bacterium]